MTENGTTRLLIDPRVVRSTDNVATVLGAVEKSDANPLFVEDKPWEVRYDNLYANVRYDEDAGLYRAWYNPFIICETTANTPVPDRASVPYRPGNREMAICYAESDDGIVWRKPELGIEEFGGDKRNNIVLRNIHGAGVMYDPYDFNSHRRYKAFMQEGVATSPDGFHWTRHPAPGIGAVGDTHNNVLYDPATERYVGFTRLWDGGQRIVARTESPDFVTWTPAQEVMRALPDAPHRQVYTHNVFLCNGLFLALTMVLDTETDFVDTELSMSTDTVTWERICTGTPLIPRGPEGSFDYGCIYGAAYPVLRGDTVALYYGGSDGVHGGWRRGGLGLANLPRDRYAGLRVGGDGTTGVVTTEPFVCSGGSLRLNVDAAEGSCRVAVAGSDVHTLDACDQVGTDAVDVPVTWDGADLRQYAGREISLRFELEDATLYAFSVED